MEMQDIKSRILDDVDPERKKEKRKQVRRAYVIVLLQFIALIASVVVIFYMMMGFSTVDGNSMYPTLHDREVVLFQRHITEYQIGDIVVVARPDGRDFVKRVVAVAGDTVNIQGGRVYVNGEELKIAGAQGETNRIDTAIPNPYVVKDNQVFVLGDNRENSEDSRSFGAVDLDAIRGKLRWYLGKL